MHDPLDLHQMMEPWKVLLSPEGVLLALSTSVGLEKGAKKEKKKKVMGPWIRPFSDSSSSFVCWLISYSLFVEPISMG